MKRLVIDANALASGSVSPNRESPTRLLYVSLASGRFEAILCPELLGEVADTLRKPYFLDRVGGEGGVGDIVTGIAENGTVLEDPPAIEPLLRDPDDDYLVALARQADADAIVTGDKDLLDHPGLQPPAIDARTACKLIGLI